MKKNTKIDFPIDTQTNQETRDHGNSDLPIGVYHQHMNIYRQGCSPWHWHKEAELYFVLEGAVRVVTTAGEYIIGETEGCFINTNCLHAMYPHECDDVIFQSVVFDPFVISSSISLLFDEKYLYPLLKCKQIPAIAIDSQNPFHSYIYKRISHIIFLHKKQEFGYEMVMRNILSEIWLTLLKMSEENIKKSPRGADMDYERIHIMLSFIHEHYTEELSLETIADAASISVSECCRCFQRCLKQSPFDYLIEYRIRQAAEMLLSTDKIISEICTLVGFNSSSYFSTKFKSIMNMSPKDYRKQK
ncbi:MAG: helix-turn-helix domain-containing protein [Eubacteriales bacterium]|nr:helix-turn-helix domain-containing protein [Eubacteriales bacterium]